MKKYFLFLFCILSLLVFASCKEKTEDEPYDWGQWGEASAIKNGADWTAICGTKMSDVYPGKFVITFNNFNIFNYLRGQFSFRYVPLLEGVYYPLDYPTEYNALPDSAMTVDFGTLLDDGDVAGDRYIMLYDSAVVFYIDKIDPQTQELWGKFSASLVKYIENGYEHDPGSPDTLIFENGVYHAKIIR
ncbi:MAG: hypothetical protein Q7T20_07260 [Saprospiraceae bacterium]|nr:hypothetical protein [Saprospiraceae bacterium]